MTPLNERTEHTTIWQPYVFDQITVTGHRCIGPEPRYPAAVDTRKREPVEFSIPGRFYCHFASGPNLALLAAYAGALFGPGYYGLKSARKLGYWSDFA